MKRVTIPMPDRFHEAAAEHAGETCRTVTNLFIYALRVMLNKHGVKLPPLEDMRGEERSKRKRYLITTTRHRARCRRLQSAMTREKRGV